jgi:hypothetical protein
MAKAATAKRPLNGAQKQLEGMEDKISRKLKAQLEADRDACAEKSSADASAKAARDALIGQMEADGVDSVRCPFRDKIIRLEQRQSIKIEAVKKSDEGM